MTGTDFEHLKTPTPPAKFPLRRSRPDSGRFSLTTIISVTVPIEGSANRRRAVNRNELVARVAQKAGIPRNQAEKVLDALGDVVTEAVHKGDKVSLTGLLSIERVLRAPRTGRNPQTGEPLAIPAGYSVRLSCGSRLKAAARGDLRTVS